MHTLLKAWGWVGQPPSTQLSYVKVFTLPVKTKPTREWLYMQISKKTAPDLKPRELWEGIIYYRDGGRNALVASFTDASPIQVAEWAEARRGELETASRLGWVP